MARPVTLFTGQWADLLLEVLAQKARIRCPDGLELAWRGDHFEVDKAVKDDRYCKPKREVQGVRRFRVSTVLMHLTAERICAQSSRRGRPIVLVIYSHRDEKWKDRFVKQLEVPRQRGDFEIWDDHRIEPGTNWYPAICSAIDQSSVAVLLVTVNLLTSEFVLSEEIPRLLQRRKEGLRIFPVIVMPCAWKRVDWLSPMDVRPKNGRPIAEGTECGIEADFCAIAEEIAETLTVRTETDKEKRPSIGLCFEGTSDGGRSGVGELLTAWLSRAASDQDGLWIQVNLDPQPREE